MKYRKIILISSLLSLFLINNHIFGQSKSKEALGNSLVESILSKNIDNFKALLLPQNVVFKLLENDAPENMDKEARDSLMAKFEATYNNVYIPQYEDNFWEMVNLNVTNKIDWSNLKFVVLYKYSSKEVEYNPFLIHTKLINLSHRGRFFRLLASSMRLRLRGEKRQFRHHRGRGDLVSAPEAGLYPIESETVPY